MTEQLIDGPTLRALPLPGSFGLARIGGLTGKLVAAAQAFAGDGSRFTHAFIVLDDGQCIEAEPGGARIVSIERYLAMEEVAFCDTPMSEYMAGRLAALPEGFQPTGPSEFWGYVENLKRNQIVEVARGLEGVGYGYLQYLFLGLYALGIEWKWLKKLITNRKRMICSQLCDEVYHRAGIEVFDDGRLPQDVTPGDLAIRFGVA